MRSLSTLKGGLQGVIRLFQNHADGKELAILNESNRAAKRRMIKRGKKQNVTPVYKKHVRALGICKSIYVLAHKDVVLRREERLRSLQVKLSSLGYGYREIVESGEITPFINRWQQSNNLTV